MSFSFDKVCSNIIPVGKYKVQVTDIKFKTGSTGVATKDMVVTYTIVDGPYAKRTLVDTIYEKSFSFRLKPFLTACKVDMAREFATAEELYRFGLASAKNKIIMVEVNIRTYNGKEFNQLNDWFPLPDSTTTADEVLSAMEVNPEVRGSSLDGMVQEETVAPIQDLNEEPELDVLGGDEEPLF